MDPPAPVSVEPPTTVPVSKPKAKHCEKKPKASPSNESASAGKKRKGDFDDTGWKKRALSKATINNSDKETRPPVIETASMPKSQVYVNIMTKSSSQSQPWADEPKPLSEQPLAQSQPDEIKPKPRSKLQSGWRQDHASEGYADYSRTASKSGSCNPVWYLLAGRYSV
ncbi:hypothetical protein K443DRAFT_13130 [Laccaria amethystina LaAM-08-1]|uniref:Uncharacterized protein n=1 Tax=Laccaria amethystina LaAM-08-1 TaxID=1095629 RepID=A0A0C9WWB1_9AGAR|nr:hypothetical protein K443DRAFT_13130 [Laccaria amethystina LaAM-08-1]